MPSLREGSVVWAHDPWGEFGTRNLEPQSGHIKLKT
jgi:hypothetical protein